MVITICIGSSCHLKGSREIVQTLERLITLHKLDDKVELNGSFCIGQCVKGVCVKLGETLFSLSPDNTEAFFNEEVLGRLTE
ncbi:(2Fe-2S) ferredoxin domain-containing protein [Anaerocolumna sedimenticola]|uniref:(2Fe-2S) ferredoxin domain-containing protein n=1 Tax=Anaerocolumna sedimenticola TaxID=2696063 RepID=A0A6P1TM75_9FIRM|nr:NAD(P)H-dependent oxidoreductase subunit E [Anaerocolumna sedimenticola]QHQ60428.1 (2Fe-2S) ferredoxin domain-containing protein [Anaerocolumna sedimenticola]